MSGVCNIAFTWFVFVTPVLPVTVSLKIQFLMWSMQGTEDSKGTPLDIWPWSEPVLPWHHCHIIDSHRPLLSFLFCCQGERRPQLLKFSSFTWLYSWLWAAILKTAMRLDILFIQCFPNRIFSRQLGSSFQESPDLLLENDVGPV